MSIVLHEVGGFGGVEDDIDADFARISGVKGTDLRRVLLQYQPALDAAKKMVIGAPYSPKAWDAKAAADALQYEIDKRAELKGDSPVPGWLLTQIAGHMKKLYGAADGLQWQAAPLLPFIGGALPALLAPELRPDIKLPGIPTWVKVAGVGAAALVVLLVVREVKGAARHLAPAPLRGVPSKRQRRPRRE